MNILKLMPLLKYLKGKRNSSSCCSDLPLMDVKSCRRLLQVETLFKVYILALLVAGQVEKRRRMGLVLNAGTRQSTT